MLEFLKRDSPGYAWSISTLDRRLRHLKIFYTDTNVTVDEVKEAVGKELKGPGQPLGYRALHKKLLKKINKYKIQKIKIYTIKIK